MGGFWVRTIYVPGCYPFVKFKQFLITEILYFQYFLHPEGIIGSVSDAPIFLRYEDHTRLFCPISLTVMVNIMYQLGKVIVPRFW